MGGQKKAKSHHSFPLTKNAQMPGRTIFDVGTPTYHRVDERTYMDANKNADQTYISRIKGRFHWEIGDRVSFADTQPSAGRAPIGLLNNFSLRAVKTGVIIWVHPDNQFVLLNIESKYAGYLPETIHFTDYGALTRVDNQLILREVVS